MPAPSFLKGLPKPVLFGLYGAIGGLLGAVALGEPLWQLLKPPPAPPPAEPEAPPPPPPQVAVSSSASVQLYPGTNNKFSVKIVRARFEGPVTVGFTSLPLGITIPPVTVPTDKIEAEATVTAAATAKPGKVAVTMTAIGADRQATASADIDIVIVPIPPPEPRLAVAVPPKLSVFKTGSCTFAVHIARAEFDGPVTVTFDPLPDGVKLPPITIPAGKTEQEVKLTTDRTADVTAADKDTAIGVKAEASVNGKLIPAAGQSQLKVLAPPSAPVDIVFVLDISGSMQYAINGTRDGIQKFADELGKQQLDTRLGLVGFRDTTLGQPNTILKFEKGEKFTTDMKLFRQEVGKLTASGGGAAGESSLDGLADGVEYPWREQATRVIVLVTDEPPKNPDRKVKNVDEAKDLVKGAKIDQMHLVVYPQLKPMFEPLWKGAEGKYFNLQELSTGRDGFDKLMPELGKAIAATIKVDAVKAEVAPPPKPPVIPAGAVAVTPVAPEAPPVPVLAPPPPAPEVKSLQSDEQYEKGAATRLLFAIGVWMGAIAGLLCLALTAGQHHYLRGTMPAIAAVAAGIGGGLVAGLVGGMAGQGLYMVAPKSEAAEAAFQVLGWALAGGLAGVGLSLLVPNMKWYLGLVGGAIGGAVGAAGYLGVAAVATPIVGRIVGGLLLGFFIGLMVALVEAAFRKAWLEVRYGREVIAVNLGPEPVKVGGDAKACTVWARGAAPIALRYFIRDGEVICDDVVMKREATVANGAEKEVGNVTVIVRTGGSNSAPSAPPPARPKPLPVPKPTAAPPPAAAPLSLDDDFDPLPMAPPPPPAAPKPAMPAASKPVMPAVPPKPPAPAPAPAAPPAASRPAMPAVPPKPPAPASKPAMPAVPPAAPKPATAKNPDGCPSCGKVQTGAKGTRYCMVCDQTF